MSNTIIPKVTITFSRLEEFDSDGDTSMLKPNNGNYRGLPADEIAKYEAQDAQRLREYHAGKWYFVGIKAKATIYIERRGDATFYELESPGLWGIESDSGEVYFNEVFKDECATLRADIEAMKLAEFK